MKQRFFWLYADGKTVKEISWEEWRKIANDDYKREKTRKICRVDNTEFYARKGNNFIWIPRRQLEEVLGHATSL